MSTAHDGRATLVRMVNQIAANYPHKESDDAAALVAEHLRAFWAPSMRAELESWAHADGEGLDPVARQAVDLLARG